MNPKIKDGLGLVVMGVLLALGISAILATIAYYRASQPTSFRSFNVSAEGRVVALPDVGEFRFGVVTEGGKDIGRLQQENIQKMNKILAFVQSTGVEKKDIKTEQYQLEPRYQYSNCISGQVCPPPEIVGYTIRQSVHVKARDFNTVSDLVGGVVESGANTVSQLQFTIDDPTAVQNKARLEAIEKAKIKALSIAKAGGFQLGRLLSVDEGYSNIPRYYGYDNLAMRTDTKEIAPSPVPVIEPGSQEVLINITLQYEIK